MIVLYGCGPGFGLPEISPYVCKTQVQLKLMGLDYRLERASPERSPKGQLPFIEDDGELVADSHFIRLHLERKYGLDLDAGCSAAERGQVWAMERMVESQLGWMLAADRWLDDANFAKGPAMFFAEIREPMRSEVCREVRKEVADRFHAVGLGRHAPEEAFGLAVRSLQALSATLGSRPFLLGERPCSVDATAFAFLAGLSTPWFDGPLRRAVLALPNLAAYVERLMVRFYPDFLWGAPADLAA
jgi:glutathione S-transferase